MNSSENKSLNLNLKKKITFIFNTISKELELTEKNVSLDQLLCSFSSKTMLNFQTGSGKKDPNRLHKPGRTQELCPPARYLVPEFLLLFQPGIFNMDSFPPLGTDFFLKKLSIFPSKLILDKNVFFFPVLSYISKNKNKHLLWSFAINNL